MDKTARFYMNWAIEAAEARRDQWQVRSEEDLGPDCIDPSDRMNDLCNELYEESQYNAKGIASGISTGITHMRQAATESEALVAMMIWEYANLGTDVSDNVRDWLIKPEGAYEGRDNTLHIARQWTGASDWAYANGFDDSEDWEFIPRMMPLLAESFDSPKEITAANVQATAEFVVEKYKEDGS